MKYRLSFGRSEGEIDLREPPRLGHFRGPWWEAERSIQDEVRRKIAEPLDAPPIHRAVTPDDHIAIVFDARLEDGVELLVPLLETLCRDGGIQPKGISLVYDGSLNQANIERLIESLPDEWSDLQMVEHRPDDQHGVAYLASTMDGRRVYLNRQILDADFFFVVSRVGYDPVCGRESPITQLYPKMSNAETRATARRLAMESRLPADPLLHRQASREVAELAGLFYSVGVSIGADGLTDQIWMGRYDAVEEAARAYSDQFWKIATPSSPAELVIAVCSPQSEGSTWATVGAALETASRLVDGQGGAIALVSDLSDASGEGGSLLRGLLQSGDDVWAIAHRVKESSSSDAISALQIAHALAGSRVFLLSKLGGEVVESMGMASIASLHELDNLARRSSRIMLVENADLFSVPAPRKSIYAKDSIDEELSDADPDEALDEDGSDLE